MTKRTAPGFLRAMSPVMTRNTPRVNSVRNDGCSLSGAEYCFTVISLPEPMVRRVRSRNAISNSAPEPVTSRSPR